MLTSTKGLHGKKCSAIVVEEQSASRWCLVFGCHPPDDCAMAVDCQCVCCYISLLELTFLFQYLQPTGLPWIHYVSKVLFSPSCLLLAANPFPLNLGIVAVVYLYTEIQWCWCQVPGCGTVGGDLFSFHRRVLRYASFQFSALKFRENVSF